MNYRVILSPDAKAAVSVIAIPPSTQSQHPLATPWQSTELDRITGFTGFTGYPEHPENLVNPV